MIAVFLLGASGGPWFVSREIAASAGDPVTVAQTAVSELPVLMTSTVFNVVVLCGSRKHVYGYVYSNRQYGVINIQEMNGISYVVRIDNGTYVLIS